MAGRLSGAGRGELRAGEAQVPMPDLADAELYFIGRISTPWKSRDECPRRGDLSGPICRIELDERWRAALAGIERQSHLQVLYWMHLSRRDLVLQNPRGEGVTHGSFALRSPLRPNPIASSIVALERVEGTTLFVRGLDCIDGTPLLDIKPEQCPKA